jgi:hypothetical protein
MALQLEPASQNVCAYGIRWFCLKSRVICANRLLDSAEAPEELGSCDMELRPTAHLRVATNSLEDGQTCVRPVNHSDRDCAVGPNNVGRLKSEQLVVQGDDLGPVCIGRRSRFRMARGYGRPELVSAWALTPQCLDTLTHRLAVSQATLADTERALVITDSQMRDQLTVAQAGITEHSSRLAMLRATVNHLCNRVADNPVDVSPLSGQYLVC